MSAPPPALAPGLYLVATPIGTARDITLRALDVLAAADVLAAEDTRTLRHLLAIHGIALGDRRVIAYHEHNGAEMRPRLVAAISEGQSVAYASDAGTPLVADPGYDLAAAVRAAGGAVHAVPGASAVLAALSVAGLPTDRFLFAGFPPPKEAARRSFFAELRDVPATLVLFESPRRAAAALATAAEVLGDRDAALCRELTKKFEEVRRATLSALAASAQADPPRGEVVLVIDRGRGTETGEDAEALLRDALDTMSLRDATDHVAALTGRKRREVYQLALRLAQTPS